MISNFDMACLSNDMKRRHQYAKVKNIKHSANIYLLCILSMHMMIWKGLEISVKVLNSYIIKVVLDIRYYLKGVVEKGGFINIAKRGCLQ